MADPSPDAALQGLLPENGLLSDGLCRSKQRSEDNYRTAIRMRNRRWRKQWTPGNHKLHKTKITQKFARRDSERAFKRRINDRAKKIGLSFRLHSITYTALREKLELIGAECLRLLKIMTTMAAA